MTGYEITSLVELCRAAGEIAYRYYDDPPQELKQDLSVVTAADRAIEQFLAAEFDRPENGSYLIGEETVGLRDEAYLAAALEAEYCWIVDPIDGTAPYATHFPAWGISIGLMRRGVLSDGAIYLPEQDRLLITENELVWSAGRSSSSPRRWNPAGRSEFRSATPNTVKFRSATRFTSGPAVWPPFTTCSRASCWDIWCLPNSGTSPPRWRCWRAATGASARRPAGRMPWIGGAATSGCSRVMRTVGN